MRKKLIAVSIHTALLGMGAIHAANLQADEAAARGTTRLEEVVVSATKRDDMVQNVPASIGVVTGERLQASQVNDATDLQKAVTGFTYKEGGNGRSSALSIRGIGTLSFSDAVDPSVGTVIDGVVMGSQAAGMFNFADIERIEVLRGPQGTLFGMNSSAGVLNVVTKDPTPQVTGEFGVGYGSYEEIKIRGAVSGPLIEDTLLFRVSAFANQRDGYIENEYNGTDLNDDDQKGVRAKFKLTPRDATSLLLALDWLKQERHCCAPTARVANPVAFDPYAAPLVGLAGDTNDKVIEPNALTTYDLTRGASLQWDETIGDYALTTVTAYREWDTRNRNAFNTQPVPLLTHNDTDTGQHQFSQEIRIASPVGETVDYVAGLFFFDQSMSSETTQMIDLGALLGLPAGLLRGSNAKTADVDTKNYAAFGEANFNISDELTLIAGARLTHIDVQMHNTAVPFPGTILLPTATLGTIDDEISDSKPSWKLGARWQITPQQMLYATVSTGYKGPAFNTNSGNGSSQQVDPELSTNYEIGSKSSFLDDRLRTNLSLFFTRFEDFQAEGLIGSGITRQFVLVNAGELESQGVEFEIDAVPIENLTVHASAAYIDAKFEEFDGAKCYSGQTAAQGCVNGAQDLAGGKLPGTPRETVKLSANYDLLFDTLPFDAFVRADYSWQDEVLWDVYQDPQTIESGYAQLGAAFGIKGRDSDYTVTVYGKNLTDEFHTSGIQSGPLVGAQYIQFLPPDYQRVYGVSLDYRFK